LSILGSFFAEHLFNTSSLIVTFTLLFLALLLGGLLLGLGLLLASVSGQRLLQNLENLLILNLLVGLVLLEIQGRGGTQLGNTVLGNGCATC
jgi:hypothetical protein